MFKLRTIFILVFIAIFAVLLVSCQNSESINAPEIDNNNSLNKATIPANATIDEVKLYLYQVSGYAQEQSIHRITADWIEGDCSGTDGGVTWNSFHPAGVAQYDGDVTWATFPTLSGYPLDPKQWLDPIDITDLVKEWQSGVPNYGLLIKETRTNPTNFTEFRSKDGTNGPYIVIKYTPVGGSQQEITEYPLADTYVWQLTPGINYGCQSTLKTGSSSSTLTEQKKYALLKFDFDFIPQNGGCTLTPGYWKTHSIYGPAPYNQTWIQVGEDTPFFLSGKSYYQALHTSPAGNAYYNLSFHYIAAKLNFLNGASVPPEVESAYDQATAFFQTYTPSQIALLKGNNSLRQQFISLAGLLGSYNEGIIGPGHCD